MSLADRIQESQVIREKIAAENQARRDEERRQQDQKRREEIEQAQKDIEQYEREREKIEKELAEIQRRESLSPEQRREEDISNLQKSLDLKYQPEIQKLEQEKSAEVNRIVQQVAQSGQGPSGWKEAARLAAKPFDEKIETLQRQRGTEYQLGLYRIEYGNRPIQGSVLREFLGSGGQISLVSAQQRRDEAAEARRQFNVLSSQQTARAETAKYEKETLEKLKQEFQIKKTEADKQYEQQTQSLKDISFETNVKKIPGKQRSDPLRDLPYQNPKSIYGTTEAKSNLARETFKKTQQQQKELEFTIRSAPNAQEAARLRKEFFDKKGNAYLGTAQSYQYKGRTLDTKGVTIEEKPNEAVSDFVKIAEAELEKPEQTKHFKIELQESLNLSENIGDSYATIYETRKPQGTIVNRDFPRPEETIFVDENDNVIPATPEMIFAYRQELLALSQINFLPSKTDLELAKYEKENALLIDQFSTTDQAKQSGTITPLVDRSKLSFESGVIGHADEIADMIRGQETKNPSLESLAVSDLLNEVKAGVGLAPRKESETTKTLQEHARTKEGQAWLAGTLLGSAGVAAASIVIPGVAAAKLTKLAGKQTLKEAEQIAIKISTKTPDEAFIATREKEIFTKLKEQFKPRNEKEIEQLKTTAKEMQMKEQAQRTMTKPAEPLPYEVKLIDRKTALITIGTENTESKVILYSKDQSIIFEPPRGTQTIYKDLLIRGRQTDLKQIRSELKRKYPDLAEPKNQATLETLASKMSKDLEQAKLIISKRETYQAQKENPLLQKTKETISLGNEKRQRRVLKGTDNIYYEKSDLSRAKPTAKNLKQIQDETEYAFTGTAKIVSSELLRKYPNALFSSLEKEDPLKAVGIFERNTPARKPAKTVKKSDFDLPVDKGITLGSEKTTKARSYTEGDFTIEKPNPTKTQETITIKKPKPSLAKLEQTAKDITPPKTSYADQATKIGATLNTGLKSSLGQQAKPQTKTQQSQRSESIQSQVGQQAEELGNFEVQKIKIIPDTKQENLIDTGLKLTITEKTNQAQPGKYSLISDYVQRQKTIEDLRFKITTRQKTIQRLIPKLDVPTEQKKPPRIITQIPPAPKTKIDVRKKPKPKLAKLAKVSKLYFRWNVNELSPGYYLPTQELSTGRTTTAIKRIEKVQRREAKRKIRFKLY